MFPSTSHNLVKLGIGVLAVALLLAGFWFVRNSEYKITNYPSSGTDIIAFGDSLVAGVGSESGGGFVGMLASDLGIDIINLGVSGNTTKDALNRVEEIRSYNPKIVLVLLGGNDFLRKVPEEETFANLENIVKEIQSLGSIVLLLGVQSGVIRNRHEEAFRDLAKKYGTAYVSDILDGIFGHPSLMADPLHPNDRGYRMMADRVRPVLKDLVE